MQPRKEKHNIRFFIIKIDQLIENILSCEAQMNGSR